MFSRSFIIGVVIPLNLIKLCGLVSSDSVLLIQNFHRTFEMVSSTATLVGDFRHLLSWER
jgi:hypothetical protein